MRTKVPELPTQDERGAGVRGRMLGGFGRSKSVADIATELGCAQNSRVELVKVVALGGAVRVAKS